MNRFKYIDNYQRPPRRWGIYPGQKWIQKNRFIGRKVIEIERKIQVGGEWEVREVSFYDHIEYPACRMSEKEILEQYDEQI